MTMLNESAADAAASTPEVSERGLLLDCLEILQPLFKRSVMIRSIDLHHLEILNDCDWLIFRPVLGLLFSHP